MVELSKPCLLAVQTGLNQVRYASLKGIMAAKKKPLEKLAAAEASIDVSLVGADGSRVHCGDFKSPPAKEAGQIIEDEDTAETVEKIVAWLDERKLI